MCSDLNPRQLLAINLKAIPPVQTYAITSKVYMDTIKIKIFAMHRTQIVDDYHFNNWQINIRDLFNNALAN